MGFLQEGTIYRAHFFEFFSDAATFAIDAADSKPSYRRDTLIRAAIVNSALSLEAAANCCLHALRLEKTLYEDLERLQTLAKFDLFHKFIQAKGKFERGHKLVQPIKNLITFRNEYVHSKVVERITEKGRHKIKTWMPLGLPHGSEFWQPVHAVKVFTVLSDFLNYYFFDACGYEYTGRAGRQKVVQLFSSSLSIGGGEPKPLGSNLKALACPAQGRWDLEFAFLGLSSYGVGSPPKQIYPKRILGDYSHCKVP